MAGGSRPLRSVRSLSPDHVRRLRAIVVDAGSIHRAAREVLATSHDTVEDALTGGTFRMAVATRLEETIDRVHAAGAPS